MWEVGTSTHNQIILLSTQLRLVKIRKNPFQVGIVVIDPETCKMFMNAFNSLTKLIDFIGPVRGLG